MNLSLSISWVSECYFRNSVRNGWIIECSQKYKGSTRNKIINDHHKYANRNKKKERHNSTSGNNISSLYVARHLIDRCYICEADLLINNIDVIQEYEYETCYLGFYCKSTDDWCAKLKNGKIQHHVLG